MPLVQHLSPSVLAQRPTKVSTRCFTAAPGSGHQASKYMTRVSYCKEHKQVQLGQSSFGKHNRIRRIAFCGWLLRIQLHLPSICPRLWILEQGQQLSRPGVGRHSHYNVAKISLSRAFGPSQTYMDSTSMIQTKVNNFKAWSFGITYQQAAAPAPKSQ
jgi:hypothetical protein